jgi:DNA-directed RNA polymerase specialized sigma24 family protein
MPLLNQRWTLHDVEDVEALLVSVVSRSPFARQLSRDDRDDLVTFLFELAWKLSDNFDASRGSFCSYLYDAARRRAIDWQRSRYRTVWKFGGGRVYERPRVDLVSIDSGEGGVVESLAARAGDPAADRSPDLGGVLTDRGGQRARDLETLGLEADRRAPRRA